MLRLCCLKASKRIGLLTGLAYGMRSKHAEKRKDARVAREFEVALPHEMSSEQRLSLARDFAHELANRYGAAVDFAIHQPHTKGDVRNFHAHVLMTTRTIARQGLGEKTLIERENKWLLNHNQPHLAYAASGYPPGLGGPRQPSPGSRRS